MPNMSEHGFVRCAISTFNGKLANPEYNVQKIQTLFDTANQHDVKLLVFPELCLTAYSCQDLFRMTDIQFKTRDCLCEIRRYTIGSDLIVIVGAPIMINDCLYDCAVVIQNGKFLGIVPKQYINAHEKRWFTEYSDFSCTEIEFLDNQVPFGNIIFASNLGFNLSIEIGDDLNAVIPPSSYLAMAGANIIANLAASNEQVKKDEQRKELIKTQSTRTHSAYLYTSVGLSESTSDVVFGGCGYAYENGNKLIELPHFQNEDEIKIFDVDIDYLNNERASNRLFSESKRNSYNKNVQIVEVFNRPICTKEFYRFVSAYPFVPNIMIEAGAKTCEEIFSIQYNALARRLTGINCSKVTLGISGGLDSTLALLVAYEAFKKAELDPKGIIGITMPGFGTTNRTYNNAVKLCEALGITLLEIPIRDACIQHFKDIGHDMSIHDITYENVQARERTQILMDMANKHNGLLVGTGDLSEGVLGWCTYNGDHMSMYNVNCSIPKTLVKNLIKWYANCKAKDNTLYMILKDIVDTPISPELLPSDGKTVVQKTENSVGPYEVIDFFIYHLLRNKSGGKKIVFLAHHAFNGKYSEKELIKYYNDFIKRFFRNQFKRNCVPDGPKVGSVSLSPRGDLKMPSDADFSNWTI